MTSTSISHDLIVKGFAGNLSVSDGGNGSAAPVLFVHSFAGSAAQWQPQLDHLRNTRRAVAFDFRAHGESDPSPTNDYSIQAIADDIGVVAEQLALGRFVLVGHSMGADAAIAYASAHPDQIAGLVVEGTSGKMDDKMAKPMLEAINKNFEQQMPEYWKRLLEHASPATEMMVKHDRVVLTKEQALALIHAAFSYDPLPDLQKYPGPKLTVIARSGDTPFALHYLVPGLPVRIIDGTSHWVHLDKSDEFNEILDEFLLQVRV